MAGFRTAPATAQRTSLYTLAICSADSSLSTVSSYTFPLGPQDIHKEPTAFNAVAYVQGTASGVQPIVDQFGQGPPVYVIRGTTGTKYHSTDGYKWDGITSIQRLQALVAQFAVLNQQQMAANNPTMYTMEFYDHFMGDFWQVVPVGGQPVDMSSAAPLWGYYTLRLVATAQVSAGAPASPNAVDAALGQGPVPAAQAATAATTSTLNGYPQ